MKSVSTTAALNFWLRAAVTKCCVRNAAAATAPALQDSSNRSRDECNCTGAGANAASACNVTGLHRRGHGEYPSDHHELQERGSSFRIGEQGEELAGIFDPLPGLVRGFIQGCQRRHLLQVVAQCMNMCQPHHPLYLWYGDATVIRSHRASSSQTSWSQ